jgi:Fur family ferric uptake transcriptional regulator/Fur family peroxide stress response transcriptional regulator
MERRQTVQRSLVLSTVIDICNHPTAQEVYDEVNKIYPSIGKATVYRNLCLLVDEGKLKKVVAIEGPVHYDSTLETHCHLECRVCKKIVDVDISLNDEFYDGVKAQTGFSEIDRNLIFSGLCPQCKETVLDGEGVL